MGLARMSSAPAACAASCMSPWSNAVKKMIGVWSPRGSARRRRQISNPSIPGIRISSKTRLAGSAANSSRARSPQSTVMTWYPAASSCHSTTIRLRSLSSTTRMVALVSCDLLSIVTSVQQGSDGAHEGWIIHEPQLMYSSKPAPRHHPIFSWSDPLNRIQRLKLNVF